MRRKRKRFLDASQEKKVFDPFKVISRLMFFGVFVTFIVCLVDYSMFFAKQADKAPFVYNLVIRCLAIVATFVPYLLEKLFKVKVTFTVSTCYYLFLFLCLFVGAFYGILDRLDVISYIMNGISGFVLALFALVLVNHFYVKRGIDISPTFMAIFCIGVAVLLSLGWETYEYVCDLVFDLNMQNYKNNPVGNAVLADTMTDLIACALGATASGIMSACVYRKRPDYLYSFSITKVYRAKKNIKTKPEDEVGEIETIE